MDAQSHVCRPGRHRRTFPPDFADAKKPRCHGRKATIVGTAKDDRLRGTKRRDVIVGHGGDDRIDGLGKRDIICGNSGDDDLIGGDGSDTVDGGRPATIACNATAAFSTSSTAAAPGDLAQRRRRTRPAGRRRLCRIRLAGGTWLTHLIAGGGRDKLSGGPSADVLDGGLAADLIKGGPGSDTVTYATRQETVDVTLADGKKNDGSEKDGPSTYKRDQVKKDVENAIGGIGDDHIAGNSKVNTLLGSLGNDKMTGLAGKDLVFGGPGDDDLKGDCQVYPIVHPDCEENGDDRLSGDSGNDELLPDGGDDIAAGGDGNDLIVGGVGSDQLEGQAGDDEQWGDSGRGRSHIGNGNDRLLGGDGKDELHGESGNDTLDDGAGDDRLNGDDGDDTLFSDPVGGDYLRGDEGVDTLDLRTRTANLTLTMGVDGADDGQEGERDQVSSEIEVVLAGAGSDTIEDEWDTQNTFDGGPGNDILYAHRATDTMIGGDGIDTLSYGPFAGRDRIYFRVRIDVPAGHAVSLEPTFVQMDTSFSGIERFIGSDQNDALSGGPFADYLDGFSGEDLILGGLGGDTLLGSDGNDELRGEEGDDRLDGGSGVDILMGDSGADTLIGGAGVDDFEGGEPDPPDEETDEALDWDSAKEPTCSSTIQCP